MQLEMKPRFKIGVSSCLLGNPVRHDGGHKRHTFIADELAQEFDLVPVCPEVEWGMGIPRDAIQLEGDPSKPRLVEVASRRDLTDDMLAWCRDRLDRADLAELAGFVFKSKSPSCAVKSGQLFVNDLEVASDRPGFFAAALTKRFPRIPVIEELDLDDPRKRAQFLNSVRLIGSELRDN